MIAGRKWGHGKAAGGPVPVRVGQMPPCGRSVHDVSFSGDERIHSLYRKPQLTTLDDPHFREIVEVSAIARFVFDIRGIAANDIGVRPVFANRQNGPRSRARMFLVHLRHIEIQAVGLSVRARDFVGVITCRQSSRNVLDPARGVIRLDGAIAWLDDVGLFEIVVQRRNISEGGRQ